MNSAAATSPPRERLWALAAQMIAGLLLLSKYAQLGGPVVFAAQIVLSAAPFVIVARLPRSRIASAWPLLLLPAWAVLSTLWSQDRATTLRYSIQLFFAICGAVGVGLTVKPQHFVRVVYVSSLVFLLACIASGIQGPSARGFVLIGFTGSKNQISIDAEILFVSALALLFDGGTSPWLRLSTLAAMPMAAWLAWQSHSATGLITLIVGGAIVVILQLTRALSPQLRIMAAGLTFVSALILAPPLLGEAVGVWDTLLKTVFQKDRTLTGRTYLWTIADEAIRQHPLIGQGWKAFWTSGNAAAEGALHYFGLTDARGFGFQDTYRAVTVDLGIVGLGILLFLFGGSIFALGRRALAAPSPSTSFLLATVLTMAAISLTDFTVETGLVFTVILFAAFTYALAEASPEGVKAAAPPASRLTWRPAAPSRAPRFARPGRRS